MWYVGLDMHWKTSTCCIVDQTGRKIKSRTMVGHWDGMVEYLRSLGQPLAVCYEASCGYGVLYERLREFCPRVVVAHPGRLRLIFRSKRKNDRVDAQKLAKLLYLDEVPQVHVPSVDVRAWRELINFRRRLIIDRTRIKNGIRALLRGCGVMAPREYRQLWTNKGLQWLSQLTWPTASARMRAEILCDQLQHVQTMLERVSKQLDATAADHPGVALLTGIPGVGPRIAEAVAAYVDDPHRFARNRSVGAYAGLVPRQDSSASVNRLGHITKDGPAVLRWLLVEAAWGVARREPTIKAFFDRIAARHEGNRKIAAVATAHKLLRAMHAMLRNGEAWHPRLIPDRQDL